ncbi:endoplasmic reticulum junction formation protein lunapark-A [Trichonephila inaurata madagascariensis]|uniref:Endoplasmic reticulum junction formation protein lunapark n=1 Tax=Trichonephila inaurata madagascariensis TaxID=2747483 RepID=A0A8X7CAK7_9ARAC|nr:endoplasmic reticulum junction formation protein lunapark-A [Trichonephila inaurata madagascariensis]
MGILFSRFRAKPSTKELLEDLEKEIEILEEYKRSTEVQQKAVIGSLIFYSVLLYVIVAAVFLFYSYPVTTKDRIVYAVPFLIFPLLLYVLKKFLQWYFLQKIRHNEENLLELKKRKKSLLEFAMETETYKVVKELLEKYDPAYHRKIFEAKPAIEAPSPQPVKGSFSEMELRRRNVSPRGSSPIPLGSSGQTLTINSAAGSPNFQFFPGKSPTNPPYPTQFFQRGGQRFVRPPVPPMPRPVLPRERTFMDRLVDYLVGDGPSNRYALICRQCQSHNGMALKEEFDYVAFRCCYCFQFNPPRNQQPPPPRLTLPAPPPSAPPAITDAASSEAASTSSEDTEIESVSDVDSSISKTEGKDNADETKDTSTHRSSISSESEIQANLVEDQPYDANDSETDVHKFPSIDESS